MIQSPVSEIRPAVSSSRRPRCQSAWRIARMSPAPGEGLAWHDEETELHRHSVRWPCRQVIERALLGIFQDQLLDGYVGALTASAEGSDAGVVAAVAYS